MYLGRHFISFRFALFLSKKHETKLYPDLLISLLYFSAFPPNGLPSEYSILATFKILSNEPQDAWNLWQVIDSNKKQKVGLYLNKDTQTVNLLYSSPSKTLNFHTSSNVTTLFDGKWHKLSFSVTNDDAKMILDCTEESSVRIADQKTHEKKMFTASMQGESHSVPLVGNTRLVS